ncbi:ABC transporter substrate-binding protein [Pseudactinotalea sp.]|uniref:ABC transporter substrate-binding protein n=1 Tax=Pseudactinotalea sp. TaxID=1926260 RepID=UPI003B3B3DEB
MATQIAQLSRRGLLRLGAAAGTAGLAGTALAGCGSGSNNGGGSGSASLRFVFWGADDRVRRFQEAADLYMTQNPDTEILVEFGEIGSLETQMGVAMTAGNLPDVFWVHGNLFPQMVAEGHVMDLTEHFGQEIKSEGFTDSVLVSGQVDGGLYSLPHGLQSPCTFAKVPVLEELGIPIKSYPESYTWEEYAEYANLAHERLGPDFYGTDEPTSTGYYDPFRAWVRQRGEEFYTTDGDIGFTEDTLTAWLEYWDALRSSGGAVPPQIHRDDDPFFQGAPMIRNLAAFHLRNSNQIGELQKLSPEELVVMPLPGNGGEGTDSIFMFPNTLAIAAGTAYPEQALHFVDFLLNDPERAEIIGTTIGSPPTQEMRDVIAPGLDAAEQQFLDYIGFEVEAGPRAMPPNPPTSGAFGGEMTTTLDAWAFGQQSIEDAVAHIFGPAREQYLLGN